MAALGHGDTSGCICAWCRSDARGFKLAAGVEKKTLELHTLLTETEDLEKNLAAVARAKAQRGDCTYGQSLISSLLKPISRHPSVEPPRV